MHGDPGILASAVRRWAWWVVPDDQAADAAVETALAAIAAGASTSEACLAARSLIRSWSAHPARRPVAGRSLRAAS